MEKEKNILTLPVAIVVAGIIIGGAVFFTRGTPAKDIFPTADKPAQNSQSANLSGAIGSRAVSSTDHIVGNPSAKIIMIEYSDLECPFCKTFHNTLTNIMDEYGKAGQVAWVYRHFPLAFHNRSPKESQATECAYELAGNDGFWNYTNKIFEITPANNGLDPAKLPEIAGQIGLNVKIFQTCLDSGKYADKVQADYNDGLLAGVNGTPNTVLVLNTPITATMEKRLIEINQSILAQMQPGSSNLITIDSGKKKVSVNGAFQLPMMKEIIDLLLSGK